MREKHAAMTKKLNFNLHYKISKVYLHDKFFVISVDKVEDVQVDGGTKVICKFNNLVFAIYFSLDSRKMARNKDKSPQYKPI